MVAWQGILYATSIVLLWAWLAALVQPLDAQLPFRIPTWLQPVGMVVGVVGALFAVWCIATFIIRGRGTPAPFDPPSQFVASGPYLYVRNPMYIGGQCVMLAAGLVLASPSIIALACAFWLCAHLFVVFYEERTLERRIGESYLRYKATVNRWLPRRSS